MMSSICGTSGTQSLLVVSDDVSRDGRNSCLYSRDKLFDVVCDLHILSTFIHVISIFLNRMIMQTVLNVFKAVSEMTFLLQINQF